MKRGLLLLIACLLLLSACRAPDPPAETEAGTAAETVIPETEPDDAAEYDPLDLPIAVLTTETGKDVTSRTEYIGGTLSLLHTGERPGLKDARIGIRGRGNNTWTYEKKSYKIKLETKENLLGIGNGKAKTWVLLANVCDQSLLRNQTVLAMGNALSHIPFEPHSFPVEVYLNGEYRGCYLLAEEINVARSRVAIDESTDGVDIGYLVELSNYASGDTVFWVGEKKYQIHSDLSGDKMTRARQIAFIGSYMEQAMSAIQSGDETEVRKLVDVDSFVDAYLLEEVAKNLDMGWDSFYLTKDRGGKLCLGPCWDFDLTLGNGDSSCEYYTDLYVAQKTDPSLSNPWFYRMMRLAWFRRIVRQRWEEVKETLDTFPDYVRSWGKLGYRSFCRNFERWPIFGQRMNRETKFITSLSTYEEHYLYLADWLASRLEWLDLLFRSDGFLQGDFELRVPAESDDETVKEIRVSLTDVTGQVMGLSGSGTPFSGEEAENLLDCSVDTKYCCDSGGTLTLRFRFGEPTALRALVLTTANDKTKFPERDPSRWVLYGSDVEHGDWTVLSSLSGIRLAEGSFESTGFYLDRAPAFTYYKWVMVTEGDLFQLSEIEFYA